MRLNEAIALPRSAPTVVAAMETIQTRETASSPEFDLMNAPWPQRLAFIVDTMRELSRQTEPQRMVQTYGKRMRQILPSDGFVSLSRRDLPRPNVRFTRSSNSDNS